MTSFVRTLIILLLSSLLIIGCTAEPKQPNISLYRAVHSGNIEQLQRHIYWGTDLNQPDADGETPLHVAARNGRVVITRLLLKHGARIDAVNDKDETPLFVALMAGRTQVAKLLVDKGAKLDANGLLHQIAQRGISDRDVIRFLLRHGAQVDNRDSVSGDTPLQTAVAQGHRVLAKLLIARGADVNAPDHQGRTPLELATQHNEPELIRLLRTNGAALR